MGGSSSSGGGSNGNFANISGGATLLTKSVTTMIPSSNVPSTHDFNGTSAVVPAGLEVPANVPVTIVGTSTPLIALLGTGDFHVNGTSTGVTIADGLLSTNVALPPTVTSHTIVGNATGNGFLIPASRGRDLSGLTVNSRFTLVVPFLPNGTAGIPTNLSGTVPTNGSTKSNITLNVFYPAAFAGYKATMTVSWTANGQPVNLAQTKTVASTGVVNFTARSAHSIPANGVDSVSLALAPAN